MEGPSAGYSMRWISRRQSFTNGRLAWSGQEMAEVIHTWNSTVVAHLPSTKVHPPRVERISGLFLVNCAIACGTYQVCTQVCANCI